MLHSVPPETTPKLSSLYLFKFAKYPVKMQKSTCGKFTMNIYEKGIVVVSLMLSLLAGSFSIYI